MTSENKGYTLALENGRLHQKQGKNISQTNGVVYSTAGGGGR